MKKKTHQTILTEADKRRIMELKKQGYVHEEIARIMGIKKNAVTYFFVTL